MSKNKNPFISVVIPTHNRGKLVSLAIASAAAQNDTAMELIVSDTSTIEADRRLIDEAIEKAQASSKIEITLLRPKTRLNMADHWEFATENFSGDYLAILCDHYVLRPSAISMWRQIINSMDKAPDVLMSNVRSGFSEATHSERTSSFTGKVKLRSAKNTLLEFLKFDAWNEDSMLATDLPRGMNCLYSRRICEAVRNKHEKIFHAISPDYTSAFLLLAYADDVVLIDKPFYCTFGAESNGHYSVINGTSRFLESYPGVDQFEYCPMRIEAVQNTLWRDFTAMKNIEPRLAAFSIDIVGYCLSIYREILVKEFYGSSLDTKKMKRDWRQYVDTLDESMRQSVEEGLIVLAEREKKNTLLRRSLHRIGVFYQAKRLFRKCKFAMSNMVGSKSAQYNNALDAATKTDYYLTEK